MLSLFESILAYYAIAFAITYALWFKGASLANSASNSNNAGLLLFLGGIGPLVSSIMIRSATENASYLQALLALYKACYDYRVLSLSLIINAILLPAITIFASNYVYIQRFPSRANIVTAMKLIPLCLTTLSLEECGWSGFARVYLNQYTENKSVHICGFINGFLWGLWHFPLFVGNFGTHPHFVPFGETYYKLKVINKVVAYGVMLGLLRMYMTQFLYDDEQRLDYNASFLPSLLCHSTLNLTESLFILRAKTKQDIERGTEGFNGMVTMLWDSKILWMHSSFLLMLNIASTFK